MFGVDWGRLWSNFGFSVDLGVDRGVFLGVPDLPPRCVQVPTRLPHIYIYIYIFVFEFWPGIGFVGSVSTHKSFSRRSRVGDLDGGPNQPLAFRNSGV